MSKATPQHPQAQVPAPRAEPLKFPELLERSKGEIAKILPEGMSVDRVARIALSVYKLDPKIQGCTPVSILASVMKSCELGLVPGGVLSHAYLIPYGRECTFQVGYKGLLKLAWETGHYREIDTVLVYENDIFEVTRDPRPAINHRPNLFTPGAEVGVYAYAINIHGEIGFEWMNRADVEKVRAIAKAGPAWSGWWGEMAKKTVLKRYLKDRPLSPRLAQALEYDNQAMAGETPRPVTATATAGLSRSAALAMRLRADVLSPEEELDPEPSAAGSVPVSRVPAAGSVPVPDPIEDLESDAGMRG